MLASGAASAGELTIVGTGDGIEMLQAVASTYNASHEGDVVSVPPSIGSGGAVAAVGSDRQKLGRVARSLTDAEKAQGLVEAPLVRIPSAIFVHADAGVRGLTSEQVAAIFAGKIENWKDVGGADLKIRVVRREDTDSTLGVLRASMPGWRDLVITSHSKTATTTQDAVGTVRDVPGAIGFGPFSPALAGPIVVLAVNGRQPRDTGYPSAVTLSLIYKQDKLDDQSKSFLAFVKQPVARQVLTDGGGAPLTP